MPLRLGLVIDTSASITSRFAFEQGAAANFLREVVTDNSDQVFVVGFANSVLLVRDFTNDETQIANGLDQLAPAGGTAAWDAIAFAAEKLASRREERPEARILAVISDGDDNSSSATLNEAIESAQRGEVVVYSVSTLQISSGKAWEAIDFVNDSILVRESKTRAGIRNVPLSTRCKAELLRVPLGIPRRVLERFKNPMILSLETQLAGIPTQTKKKFDNFKAFRRRFEVVTKRQSGRRQHARKRVQEMGLEAYLS